MWERVFDVKVAAPVDGKTERVLAWALCSNIGLVAIDIRNPEEPEIVHAIHINKFLWHLEIQGDKAYIACGKDGIVICDISSLAEAKIISSIALPYHATDISVGPDRLYVSNGKEGISIIDSNSGEIIEHLEVPGNTLRLAYHNTKLFTLGHVGNRGLLHIYSTATEARLQLLKTLKFEGVPRDYLFWDDAKGGTNTTMYLANGRGGVGIVKTTSEGSATFKGSISTPFRSNRLARYGDQICVFGRNGNVTLYPLGTNDIFVPELSLHSCSRIFGAAIFNNYAIIAAGEKGITIVDLLPNKNQKSAQQTTPLPLQHKASWKVTEHGIVVRLANKIQYLKYQSFPETSATSLELAGLMRFPWTRFFNAYTVVDSDAGTWIYMVLKGSGLHIIHIDADGTLEQRGIIKLPTGGREIEVNSCTAHADKLYLCSNDGLIIYDISSPEIPRFVATEYMAQNILNINFDAQHAYIAGTGVRISPIKQDNTLGASEIIDFPEHLISSKRSLDITSANGILYIACGYRGILRIDVRDPQHPNILDSMELQGYCSKVETQGGLLATQAGETVYLLDVSNPKRMVLLCQFENMQDFHINTKNNELLQLRARGITSTPLPLILEPTHTSTTKKLEFQMPAHIQEGRYNIYINLDGIHNEHVGSTICTLNEAQRSECTSIPIKSD